MLRNERRVWWCDGPIVVGWVDFQTYKLANHGGWYIPTEPWFLIELQPWETA